MQLSQFSPERSLRPESPLPFSEKRSLREIGRSLLRAGDPVATSALADIAAATDALRISPHAEDAQELQQLQAEVDAQWDVFQTEVASAIKPPLESGIFPTDVPISAKETPSLPQNPALAEIDAGWEETLPSPPSNETEVPVTTLAMEAVQAQLTSGSITSLETLLTNPDARESAQLVLREALYSTMTGGRVNFSQLERLVQIVDTSPTLRPDLQSELRSTLGPLFSERILRDPAYRADLAQIQRAFSGTYGEHGPEICPDANLEQLVLAHELFGTHIRDMIDAMNLGSHATELRVQQDAPILFISSPHFDETTGECSGSIGSSLRYASLPGQEDEGRIDRTFEQRILTDEHGIIRTERVATLDLIRVPHALKSQNTAKSEMAATERFLQEAGFDRQALHANIDIGGYAWAGMDFDWDLERMQRRGEQLAPAEVLSQFIADRIDIVQRNLRDSDIDIDDPQISALFSRLQAFQEHPLAVTPKHLAALGKEGPSFILGTSGNYYLETDYEAHRKTDPPHPSFKGSLHLGKMLLLGSDWYGQKQLTRHNP